MIHIQIMYQLTELSGAELVCAAQIYRAALAASVDPTTGRTDAEVLTLTMVRRQGEQELRLLGLDLDDVIALHDDATQGPGLDVDAVLDSATTIPKK